MDEGTHFHFHLIPRYIDDNFWDNQIVKEHKLSLQELKLQLNALSLILIFRLTSPNETLVTNRLIQLDKEYCAACD